MDSTAATRGRPRIRPVWTLGWALLLTFEPATEEGEVDKRSTVGEPRIILYKHEPLVVCTLIMSRTLCFSLLTQTEIQRIDDCRLWSDPDAVGNTPTLSPASVITAPGQCSE